MSYIDGRKMVPASPQGATILPGLRVLGVRVRDAKSSKSANTVLYSTS